ncbi:DUF4437 domain-containing protein [Sphingorhabdus sp. EL138]|uniref:DUF4437 domain-containing protein n=1 Tax=Sphingorhabdus sp. EL138 TaxID=2073156 RepID=UPI000D698457|nr:DUF4437 domain-containing protein [Sphingorhabdus sp. EL138]
MKMQKIAIAATAICLLTASGASLLAKSVKPSEIKVTDRVIPEEQRQFDPGFPGNDAITFAVAYGDRSTGAHGTYGSFPANFETPEHTHTHDYRAIVLKGQMTNPFQGDKNAPILNPGSYWEVPAGSVHTTACVSDTPCEFYMYGDHSFDFKPTKN